MPTHRLILLPCLLIAGLASTPAPASAQETVRVRGVIERVDRTVYVVKGRDGRSLKLTLAPNAGVAASVKSALSDIKSGSYIGVAVLPQADGTLRALEVHIFHESMRDAGEGHRAWDLQPKSTMTNATVDQVIAAADGPTLTLKYRDGEKRIVVPRHAVVVTYLPGSVSELKAGAVIFRPGGHTAGRRHAASPAADGRQRHRATAVTH